MENQDTHLKFAEAGTQQSEEISRLVNSAYRGDSSRQGWTTEADILGGQRVDSDRIKELIEAPDSTVLLAFVENEILGCVHLKKEGDECYLGMLTIKPVLQNFGLGRSLLLESEKWAQNHGCKSIYMTVITLRRELIEWYERRGYKRTGEIEEFPYEDTRFGLPQRDDLEFEVLRKTLS